LFSLAQGNALVFIQILEYFLKNYSNVLTEFFRNQAKMANGGMDLLSQIKPVTDGGAPSFLGLVI